MDAAVPSRIVPVVTSMSVWYRGSREPSSMWEDQLRSVFQRSGLVSPRAVGLVWCFVWTHSPAAPSRSSAMSSVFSMVIASPGSARSRRRSAYLIWYWTPRRDPAAVNRPGACGPGLGARPVRLPRPMPPVAGLATFNRSVIAAMCGRSAASAGPPAPWGEGGGSRALRKPRLAQARLLARLRAGGAGGP